MIFAHTQDQLDLRDGAREFLRGSCAADKLRQARETGAADLGLWPELADLGLLGFLSPEDNGGLGMDAIGFSLIAEECGYVALPEPMIEVAGVSLAVLNSLSQSDSAQELASGQSRVITLHELNPYVNQLSQDDLVLTVSNDEIRLIKASDCRVEAIESIDPMRRLSKVTTPSEGGVLLAQGSDAKIATATALRYGALLSSAELLGLSARMIDMATDYAKDRQQFGKPIGSYQAVKHHLASALVKLEFARPCVYRAAADLASDSSRIDLSIAHAKIAASDAAINAAETAIQIHGGMGYTFEVDLHMWMKRTWALAGLWGDGNYHMRKLDSILMDSDLPTGPSETFM